MHVELHNTAAFYLKEDKISALRLSKLLRGACIYCFVACFVFFVFSRFFCLFVCFTFFTFYQQRIVQHNIHV